MKKFILFAMTFVAMNASAGITCNVVTSFQGGDSEVEDVKLQGIDTQVGVSKNRDITLTYDPRKPGILNVQAKGEHCSYKECYMNVDTLMNGKFYLNFDGFYIESLTCK